MLWAKFETELEKANFVFIYDDQQNGQIEGILRGLPAISYAGITTVTCPKSWLQIDGSTRHELYEYEWSRLQDIRAPDESIIAATTQYYEDNLAVYSIKTLINRFTSTDHTLCVIADEESFQPSGAVRPFREEPVVDCAWEYSDIYDAYQEHYENYDVQLPIAETKNLFVQDNANMYRLATGDTISSIEELVAVLPNAPYLPFVRGVSSIFSKDDGVGSEPLESNEAIEDLGKWLRRRLELEYREGISIAKSLNDYATSHERLFDPAGRRQMPEMNCAREPRRELAETTNPIHERYHRWFDRALT